MMFIDFNYLAKMRFLEKMFRLKEIEHFNCQCIFVFVSGGDDEAAK